MRLKFLILFTLMVCLPALAQRAGVTGVVVDAKNGEPVIGASVMLDNQGGGVVTDLDGRFRIDNATSGNAMLSVMSIGYKKLSQPVSIGSEGTTDLGTIRIKRANSRGSEKHYNRVAVSYTHYLISNADEFGKNLPGVGIELLQGIRLMSSKPLYLEYGLKFTYARKSHSHRYVNDYYVGDNYYFMYDGYRSMKISTMNLSVPINLAYRITLSSKRNIAFVPFAGVSVGAFIMAKNKQSGFDVWGDKMSAKDYNLFDDGDMDGNPAKRFQAGWQAGFGLTYKAFSVGVSYGSDFTKFLEYEYGSAIKLSTLAASISYSF